MNRELSKEKIVYNFKLDDVDFNFDSKGDSDDRLKIESEYGEIYEKIKASLNIDKEGYNIYIIENFSKDRLENIMNFISKVIKDRRGIEDILSLIHI